MKNLIITIFLFTYCRSYGESAHTEYFDIYSGHSLFSGPDGFRCKPIRFDKTKRFQDLNYCSNDEWNYRYIRAIKPLNGTNNCDEICKIRKEKKFFEDELNHVDLNEMVKYNRRLSKKEVKYFTCINKGLIKTNLFDLEDSGLFGFCVYDSKKKDCVEYLKSGIADSCLCAYYLHYKKAGEDYKDLYNDLAINKCNSSK